MRSGLKEKLRRSQKSLTEIQRFRSDIRWYSSQLLRFSESATQTEGSGSGAPEATALINVNTTTNNKMTQQAANNKNNKVRFLMMRGLFGVVAMIKTHLTVVGVSHEF